MRFARAFVLFICTPLTNSRIIHTFGVLGKLTLKLTCQLQDLNVMHYESSFYLNWSECICKQSTYYIDTNWFLLEYMTARVQYILKCQGAWVRIQLREIFLRRHYSYDTKTIKIWDSVFIWCHTRREDWLSIFVAPGMCVTKRSFLAVIKIFSNFVKSVPWNVLKLEIFN